MLSPRPQWYGNTSNLKLLGEEERTRLIRKHRANYLRHLRRLKKMGITEEEEEAICDLMAIRLDVDEDVFDPDAPLDPELLD